MQVSFILIAAEISSLEAYIGVIYVYLNIFHIPDVVNLL